MQLKQHLFSDMSVLRRSEPCKIKYNVEIYPPQQYLLILKEHLNLKTIFALSFYALEITLGHQNIFFMAKR